MRCPEHAGSRVKLDGTYGKPSHRRQRCKCTPRRGKPHVFTKLLPREEAAALYPRRYALNRERLNRLLTLLQLHVNGHDDVQGNTKTIRSWLEANGGCPVAQRRAIADPAGAPSLR